MRHLLPCLALVGCTTAAGLPPLEHDVPIVGAEAATCAQPRDVDVACVLDGDTFDIGTCGDRGERVRLLGIDAPEIAHDGNPADCYGVEAEQILRQWIDGRRAVLSFDARCVDVFGRTLAYLWLPVDPRVEWEQPEDLIAGDLGEVELLNERMLLDGYAPRYANAELEGDLLLKDRLDAAERSAREARRGLWSACAGD